MKDQSPGEEKLLEQYQRRRSIVHPQVPAPYDLHCEGGNRLPSGESWIFYTRPFLRGETLWQLRHSLSPREARECLLELMLLFADLRHQNLARLDLRPWHILRNETGWNVLDLDPVTELETEQHPARGFLAPERLCGKIGDISSDLYGAGACVWYGITGTEPPATKNWGLESNGTHSGVLADFEAAPGTRSPDLSRLFEADPQLNKLLLRLLGKDPARGPMNLEDAIPVLAPKNSILLELQHISAPFLRDPWTLTDSIGARYAECRDVPGTGGGVVLAGLSPLEGASILQDLADRWQKERKPAFCLDARIPEGNAVSPLPLLRDFLAFMVANNPAEEPGHRASSAQKRRAKGLVETEAERQVDLVRDVVDLSRQVASLVGGPLPVLINNVQELALEFRQSLRIFVSKIRESGIFLVLGLCEEANRGTHDGANRRSTAEDQTGDSSQTVEDSGSVAEELAPGLDRIGLNGNSAANDSASSGEWEWNRISRMDDPAAALSVAIFSEAFSLRDCSQVVSDPKIGEIICQFERAGLLVRVYGPGDKIRWHFRSDLIRQSLEARITPDRRRTLHQRMLWYLQEQSLDASIERATLARHFVGAGQPEGAKIVLQNALARAIDTDRPGRAIRYVEILIPLTTSGSPAAQILHARHARLLQQMHYYAEAAAVWQALRSEMAAAQHELSIEQGVAEGRALVMLGRYSEAIQVLALAPKVCGREENAEHLTQLMSAYQLLAFAQSETGNLEGASSSLKSAEAAGIARGSTHWVEQGYLEAMIGHRCKQDPKKLLRRIAQTLPIAAKLGDRRSETRLLVLRAAILNDSGDLDTVILTTEEVWKTTQATLWVDLEAGVCHNLGELLQDARRLDEADLMYARAVELYRRMGNMSRMAGNLLDRVGVLHRAGHLAVARQVLQTAAERADGLVDQDARLRLREAVNQWEHTLSAGESRDEIPADNGELATSTVNTLRLNFGAEFCNDMRLLLDASGNEKSIATWIQEIMHKHLGLLARYFWSKTTCI